MIRTLFGLLIALAASLTLAAESADKSILADNAPDSYTVKKGDTLWAISGVFLKQPWRWPEIWKLNQDQIRNPHLIYPGQVVVLDRNNMTLSLGKQVTTQPGDASAAADKLSPRVYASTADTPIASIPLDSIRTFLVEPLVVEEADTVGVPAVVGIQEQRVAAGPGDSIYAKNLAGDIGTWSVYRRGEAIRHPETGKVLGYEAQYVAKVEVLSGVQGNTAAELKIVAAKQEVMVGDRLMPAGKSELIAVPPHAPGRAVSAAVASAYGGLTMGGRNSVVVVTAGKDEGLEVGHVLTVSHNSGSITYRDDGKRENYVLPNKRIGYAYVFRVFNKLSYALLIEAGSPVYTGDLVTSP